MTTAPERPAAESIGARLTPEILAEMQARYDATFQNDYDHDG